MLKCKKARPNIWLSCKIEYFSQAASVCPQSQLTIFATWRSVKLSNAVGTLCLKAERGRRATAIRKDRAALAVATLRAIADTTVVCAASELHWVASWPRQA
jgi:hypothetical protein